jgi:hypothetical protein
VDVGRPLGRADREIEEVSMNAFLIELRNRPGELARIAEAIASKGINITAVSGTASGEGGGVALMTADEPATRIVLKDAGAAFREVEVVEVPLPHEPGSLARATRRLADAGINIDALLVTGMEGNDAVVAFLTADPARAKEVLAGAAAGGR